MRTCPECQGVGLVDDLHEPADKGPWSVRYDPGLSIFVWGLRTPLRGDQARLAAEIIRRPRLSDFGAEMATVGTTPIKVVLSQMRRRLNQFSPGLGEAFETIRGEGIHLNLSRMPKQHDEPYRLA